MDIRVNPPHDGVTVVEVEGEVDVHSAPDLQRSIVAALEDGSRSVVADLSALSFIDSTGLGVLVACLNVARDSEIGFALAAVGDRVVRLLDITGLDSLFTMYADVDAATKALAVSSE